MASRPAYPYVVLHHTGHGAAHFDLMIATDATGPLLTWRLPAWPCDDATAAEPLSAHRRAYLTYEGAISGDRGQVTRVASGYCVIAEMTARLTIVIFDEREMTLRL